MNRPSIFTLALMGAIGVAAATPEIQDGSVVLSPSGGSGRMVSVRYVLAGAEGIVTADLLTNGVSVGEANLATLSGDVNRLVQPGTRGFTWRAPKSVPEDPTQVQMTAVVRAWSKNLPPDYMVFDLATGAVNYYVSTNSLPAGGLSNSNVYAKAKMVFRRIPAANVTWRMGSNAFVDPGSRGPKVPHLVTLTQDYWMGVYPVTTTQLQIIMGREYNGWAAFKNAADWETQPAQGIARNVARDGTVGIRGNAAWPGTAVGDDSALGRMRALAGGTIAFNLPTSAQWEYAYRAGTEELYYTGIDSITQEAANEIAWSRENSTAEDGIVDQYQHGRPHGVGQKRPNAWGLYDMAGGINEFCLDYYAEGADYSDGSHAVDPIGPSEGKVWDTAGGGDWRYVTRGGCFAEPYTKDSATYQESCRANYAGQWYGFRVVAPIGTPAARAAAPESGVALLQDEASGEVSVAYRLSEPGIVTVDFLTNGVSIGEQNFREVGGDVNRLLAAGAKMITWRPDRTWPGRAFAAGQLTAQVRVWPTNAPPPYMVLELSGTRDALYYASSNAIPAGIGDDRYRLRWLALRKIPAAGVEWRMGTPGYPQGYRASELPHTVMLTKDYYMAVYPMTQRQHYEVANYNNSYHKGYADHMMGPVDSVSWTTQSDGKKPGLRGDAGAGWPADDAVDPDSVVGRLRATFAMHVDIPTEAQWEYACRAGTDAALYTGEEPNADNAAKISWFGTNTTAVVGKRVPNAWGLYDMCGNIGEWCLDRYAVGYGQPLDGLLVDPVGDPVGTEHATYGGIIRVVRGSNFSEGFGNQRSGYRPSSLNGAVRQQYVGQWFGYRLVVTIP